MLDFCGGELMPCMYWLQDLSLMMKVCIVGGLFLALFIIIRIIHYFIKDVVL